MFKSSQGTNLLTLTATQPFNLNHGAMHALGSNPQEGDHLLSSGEPGSHHCKLNSIQEVSTGPQSSCPSSLLNGCEILANSFDLLKPSFPSFEKW